MEKSLYDDDCLSSLYTLRAGLSLIMQDKAEIDRIVKAAEYRKDGHFARVKDSVGAAKEKVEKAKYAYAQCDKAEQDNLDIAEQRIRVSAFGVLSIIYFAVSLCALLYCGMFWAYSYLFYSSFGQHSKFFNALYGWATAPHTQPQIKGNWGFLVFIAGSVVSLVFVISSVIKLFKNICMSEYVMDNREIRRARRAKKRLKRATQNALSVKQNEEEELIGLKAHLREESDNFVKALSAEIQAQAAPYVTRINVMLNALNNTYGYLLDRRDWVNLDLIIYSIETKRADSIKEALFHVDCERRANSIVSAVNSASVEIGRAISTQYNKMTQVVHNGFSLLSHQIEAQTSRLIDTQTQIAGQTLQAFEQGVRGINESIGKQTGELNFGIHAQTAATLQVTETLVANALIKYGDMPSTKFMDAIKNVARSSADIADSFETGTLKYRYLTDVADDV